MKQTVLYHTPKLRKMGGGVVLKEKLIHFISSSFLRLSKVLPDQATSPESKTRSLPEMLLCAETVFSASRIKKKIQVETQRQNKILERLQRVKKNRLRVPLFSCFPVQ